MVPIGLHKPLPFLVLRQLLRITSTLLPVASTRRVPQILVGTVTQYVVWLLALSYAYGCNIPSSIGALREASFSKNSFYLERNKIIIEDTAFRNTAVGRAVAYDHHIVFNRY